MPGGVVVNPPELVRAAVLKEIPDLPLEHFDRIGSTYNIERAHVGTSPASVRKRLQTISAMAGALWVELGTLPEEVADALWHASYRKGRPGLQDEASFALQCLMGVGRDAALIVQTSVGAPTQAKRAMVRSLAALLENLGHPADDDEKGELVFLTRSILESYGEQIKHVPKLVKNALENNRQN